MHFHIYICRVESATHGGVPAHRVDISSDIDRASECGMKQLPYLNGETYLMKSILQMYHPYPARTTAMATGRARWANATATRTTQENHAPTVSSSSRGFLPLPPATPGSLFQGLEKVKKFFPRLTSCLLLIEELCPVLCNGRGNYVNGECQCQSGWKGKECQLREEECEVADCSGHGDCLDGLCKCFPGYKGGACEEVDCIDPDCSGHGVCLNGQCLCKKGWKSIDCSEPDQEALRCLPDCSNHGHFDIDKQRCVCDDPWSGPDCSQERCGLDCGERGRCREGRCECLDGWTGPKCDQKLCDSRCSEHGQCRNGTCACLTGWNGKHCTLGKKDFQLSTSLFYIRRRTARWHETAC